MFGCTVLSTRTRKLALLHPVRLIVSENVNDQPVLVSFGVWLDLRHSASPSQAKNIMLPEAEIRDGVSVQGPGQMVHKFS